MLRGDSSGVLRGNRGYGAGSKKSKPAMEKRRRARINASLAELRSLIPDSVKRSNRRYSKMEKADILEMAVQYLRHLQDASKEKRQISTASYSLGFSECAQEVSQFFRSASPITSRFKGSLLEHLYGCAPHGPPDSPSSSPNKRAWRSTDRAFSTSSIIARCLLSSSNAITSEKMPRSARNSSTPVAVSSTSDESGSSGSPDAAEDSGQESTTRGQTETSRTIERSETLNISKDLTVSFSNESSENQTRSNTNENSTAGNDTFHQPCKSSEKCAPALENESARDTLLVQNVLNTTEKATSYLRESVQIVKVSDKSSKQTPKNSPVSKSTNNTDDPTHPSNTDMTETSAVERLTQTTDAIETSALERLTETTDMIETSALERLTQTTDNTSSQISFISNDLNNNNNNNSNNNNNNNEQGLDVSDRVNSCHQTASSEDKNPILVTVPPGQLSCHSRETINQQCVSNQSTRTENDDSLHQNNDTPFSVVRDTFHKPRGSRPSDDEHPLTNRPGLAPESKDEAKGKLHNAAVISCASSVRASQSNATTETTFTDTRGLPSFLIPVYVQTSVEEGGITSFKQAMIVSTVSTNDSSYSAVSTCDNSKSTVSTNDNSNFTLPTFRSLGPITPKVHAVTTAESQVFLDIDKSNLWSTVSLVRAGSQAVDKLTPDCFETNPALTNDPNQSPVEETRTYSEVQEEHILLDCSKAGQQEDNCTEKQHNYLEQKTKEEQEKFVESCNKLPEMSNSFALNQSERLITSFSLSDRKRSCSNGSSMQNRSNDEFQNQKKSFPVSPKRLCVLQENVSATTFLRDSRPNDSNFRRSVYTKFRPIAPKVGKPETYRDIKATHLSSRQTVRVPCTTTESPMKSSSAKIYQNIQHECNQENGGVIVPDREARTQTLPPQVGGVTWGTRSNQNMTSKKDDILTTALKSSIPLNRNQFTERQKEVLIFSNVSPTRPLPERECSLELKLQSQSKSCCRRSEDAFACRPSLQEREYTMGSQSRVYNHLCPKECAHQPGLEADVSDMFPSGAEDKEVAQLIHSKEKPDLCLGYSNMDRGCSNMDRGCSNMDKRCSNMDRGCSNMDRRCSNMDRGCSNMDRGCSNMDRGCSNMDKRCSNMDRGCSNMDRGCSNMDRGCSNVDIGCSNVDTVAGRNKYKTFKDAAERNHNSHTSVTSDIYPGVSAEQHDFTSHNTKLSTLNQDNFKPVVLERPDLIFDFIGADKMGLLSLTDSEDLSSSSPGSSRNKILSERCGSPLKLMIQQQHFGVKCQNDAPGTDICSSKSVLQLDDSIDLMEPLNLSLNKSIMQKTSSQKEETIIQESVAGCELLLTDTFRKAALESQCSQNYSPSKTSRRWSDETCWQTAGPKHEQIFTSDKKHEQVFTSDKKHEQVFTSDKKHEQVFTSDKKLIRSNAPAQVTDSLEYACTFSSVHSATSSEIRQAGFQEVFRSNPSQFAGTECINSVSDNKSIISFTGTENSLSNICEPELLACINKNLGFTSSATYREMQAMQTGEDNSLSRSHTGNLLPELPALFTRTSKESRDTEMAEDVWRPW